MGEEPVLWAPGRAPGQGMTGHSAGVGVPRLSGAVRLDEGEDILLGQLVWVLGLLGVMHMDAIPPLPEEPAIVADVKWGNGVCREVKGRGLGFLVIEELPLEAFAESHSPWLIHCPDNVEASGHKVPVISPRVAELRCAAGALDDLHL